MQKIYFGNTPLIISSSNPSNNPSLRIEKLDKESIQAALTVLKKTDHHQLVYIHPNEETALESLKKNFTIIQAAGGLAYTPEKEVLLIFRRGKWDLPKGKLDEGEAIETCATREVEEETGLQHIVLEDLIQKTYHTYQENGTDILKETFWYYMKAQKQDLQPQTDEDIQECRWVSKQEVANYFENMQPSVKDVLETFLASTTH